VSEPRLGNPRHDPATLTAWRWAGEDRLIAASRSLTRTYDLSAEHVERMESAALHGDHAALMAAVVDLLDEVEA